MASVSGLVLCIGFFAVANFVPEETRLGSPLLPDHGLRLGLDLQGGIHWVLGVNLGASEKLELDFLGGNLKFALDDDDLSAERIRVEGGRLLVEPGSARVKEAAQAWAAGRDFQLDSVAGDGLQYELTPEWREEVRERAMRQVLEVLRRRIADPLRGIPDSVVTRQGDDRILVQIPGGQIERGRARELLRVTGFLEFKIVQDTAKTEELLLAKYAGELPEDTEIVFERDRETDRILTAYRAVVSLSVIGWS